MTLLRRFFLYSWPSPSSSSPPPAGAAAAASSSGGHSGISHRRRRQARRWKKSPALVVAPAKATRVSNFGRSFKELGGEIVGKLACYTVRGLPWLALVCERRFGLGGTAQYVCKEMNGAAENGRWERTIYSSSPLTAPTTRFFEQRAGPPPAELPDELASEWHLACLERPSASEAVAGTKDAHQSHLGSRTRFGTGC